MKKVGRFIFLCMILCLFINRVNALSVSKNNITIDKGGSENIELYANSDKEINKVEFTLIYMSNDVPASFIINNNYSDSNPNGIKHTISLGDAKSGKILLGTININVKSNPTEKGGSVNIHSAKGYTTDGEVVNLNSQSINVTIGTPVNEQEEVKEEVKKEEPKEEPKEEKKEEEKKEIDKNLLDKIESNLVKIELKKDVFEYTVIIDKEIKELDLKPVAKDKDTKVEISSQKIDEIKDNKIVITASNGDIKQEYIIKLSEKEDIVVTIDKDKFKEDNSYKGKWIGVSIVLVVILMVGFVLTKKK